MPYKSKLQERWAHTKTGKEALGGNAAVHEWDEATKGKKLPEKIEKSLPSPSVKVPNAMKMPKTKGMLKSFDESSGQENQSSIEKLRTFLENRRSK